MLRTLAILSGIVLTVVGVLGFIPEFVKDGKLLDIFRINFEHNVAHIASGILALLCGLSSSFASKIFFIIGGAVYALLAFMGIVQGHEMLFDMIAVNLASNYLHAAIAVLFLLIGLGIRV